MVGIIEVNETNFTNEVLSATVPVLVDFSAAWCAPCKMLDPIVTQLAQDMNGAVKVVILDIDKSADLAMKYQVMSVPTLMLFTNGKPVEQIIGYRSKEYIKSRLSASLR